jgi:hypothetical protein
MRIQVLQQMLNLLKDHDVPAYAPQHLVRFWCSDMRSGRSFFAHVSSLPGNASLPGGSVRVKSCQSD